MIGQGRIQTSSTGHGRLCRERDRGRPCVRNWCRTRKPAREITSDLTEDEAAQLRELMSVVTEGHLDQLRNHPGGGVLSKTFAEFGKPDPRGAGASRAPTRG